MFTDAILLERYAATRDADAFAEIVTRHAGLVFGVCRRICGNGSDAEDVTQNCFLQLARNAGRIHSSLPAWLHTVAVRSAVESTRRQRAQRLEALDVQSREHVADLDDTWRTLLPRIDEALAQLPAEQRDILVLCYLESRSQEDIGRSMGLSQSTVSRRLQDGIASLRRHLGADVALALPGLTVVPPAGLIAKLGKMGMSGIGIVGAPHSVGIAIMGISMLAWVGIVGVLIAGTVTWRLLGGSVVEVPQPTLPSRTIIYLSKSGVIADGKTDQRDHLQPLFYSASTGTPLEIINDLVGNLLTSGNDIWPNTTVRTVVGGTWLLAPGSHRGILCNRHPLASWPAGARRQDGAISSGPTHPDDAHAMTDVNHGDFNITLIAGVYDGNRRSGGWPNDGRTPTTAKPVLGRDDLLVSALQFYGVKHLVLRGVKVYDSPSLGLHVGNVIDLVAVDCEISCPAVIYGSNQDGFHINGPAQDILVTDLRIRQSGDDAIAINADDSMESTTEGNQALFFGLNTGWGPITHVRMKGVHLDRCSSGIRPLSATQRITDVIMSDIDGTCLGACILFDKYLFNHDPGNIGTFTMDGIHLATLGLTYDSAAAGFTAPSAPPAEVFYGNTNVEDLELKHVSYASSGGSRWCHLHPCTIAKLSVDRTEIVDSSTGGPGIALITVDAGAVLTDVRIHDLDWHSTHQQAATVIDNHGAIAHISTEGVRIPPQVRLVAGVQPVTMNVLESP